MVKEKTITAVYACGHSGKILDPGFGIRKKVLHIASIFQCSACDELLKKAPVHAGDVVRLKLSGLAAEVIHVDPKTKFAELSIDYGGTRRRGFYFFDDLTVLKCILNVNRQKFI